MQQHFRLRFVLFDALVEGVAEGHEGSELGNDAALGGERRPTEGTRD
jgi:hypothetical protein